MSDPLLRALRDQAIDASVGAGRNDLLTRILDDMAEQARELTAIDCGCRPHAIRPGCPRHDPGRRTA